MSTELYDFATASVPPESSDTIPDFVEVSDPCEKCGKRPKAPYGGRGPKPKFCIECKSEKGGGKRSGRVTGSAASLAAQAAETLSQLNAVIAVGCMGFGLFNTAKAIQEGDELFKTQAYNALTTDPDLCKFILKGGGVSAKAMLAVAYGGLGMAVVPTAMMELQDKKAARAARKVQAEYETGT